MMNKVAGTTTALLFILLGLLGLGNLGMAFDNSIASYAFWFHIVMGMLLLFICWALYRVVGDYEGLKNKYLDVLQEMGYSDLDDYFQKQKKRRELEERRKWEEDELDEDEKEARRQAERQQSFANVSTEELLALKDKHKSNESVVKIINDVLEARAKETKEF